MDIRKWVTSIEDTLEENGRILARPLRKVAVAAVVKNPCAGVYQEDLSELIALGEQLAALLAERAVAALGGADRVESYGKAAIVGEAGEVEHAGAILHPTFGKPVRAAVGGGKAIIPSTKKLGGMGTAIDAPIFYKDAVFVLSHIDTMQVRVPDAPRADEIVVALVVTDGGRPLARIGGMRKEDVSADGSR